MTNQNLLDWLDERWENCRRIAEQKAGKDREGWLQDAMYFALARQAVANLTALRVPIHENSTIRMLIALRVLRAWNHGTAGYDALVVRSIQEWIDSGMNTPIPWPDSPFFNQWAESQDYLKIGDFIGFKFQAELLPEVRR